MGKETRKQPINALRKREWSPARDVEKDKKKRKLDKEAGASKRSLSKSPKRTSRGRDVAAEGKRDTTEDKDRGKKEGRKTVPLQRRSPSTKERESKRQCGSSRGP